MMELILIEKARCVKLVDIVHPVLRILTTILVQQARTIRVQDLEIQQPVCRVKLDITVNSSVFHQRRRPLLNATTVIINLAGKRPREQVFAHRPLTVKKDQQMPCHVPMDNGLQVWEPAHSMTAFLVQEVNTASSLICSLTQCSKHSKLPTQASQSRNLRPYTRTWPPTGTTVPMVTFAWKGLPLPSQRPHRKDTSVPQAIIAPRVALSKSLALLAIDSLILSNLVAWDVLPVHTVVHSLCSLVLSATRAATVQEQMMCSQEAQHLFRSVPLHAPSDLTVPL